MGKACRGVHPFHDEEFADWLANCYSVQILSLASRMKEHADNILLFTGLCFLHP